MIKNCIVNFWQINEHSKTREIMVYRKAEMRVAQQERPSSPCKYEDNVPLLNDAISASSCSVWSGCLATSNCINLNNSSTACGTTKRKEAE